jgi:hypothetical protein
LRSPLSSASALFTTKNVTTYQEVRRATNRLLLHIRSVEGHVFYVGLQKNRPVAEFNAQGLYPAAEPGVWLGVEHVLFIA